MPKVFADVLTIEVRPMWIMPCDWFWKETEATLEVVMREYPTEDENELRKKVLMGWLALSVPLNGTNPS